ncbi:hypothetical protein R1sor_010267 [Riccia sorocarpa]|uniref:RING-type domain-containing protein n=1 Tax=Riccia sorocarpa TaxID=122646 RepID=A0ABD3I1K5_9MARC
MQKLHIIISSVHELIENHYPNIRMASRKPSRGGGPARGGGTSGSGAKKVAGSTGGTGTGGEEEGNPSLGPAKPPPVQGVPEERVDPSNVSFIVSKEEAFAFLKITDENRERIEIQGKVFWPTDCADSELSKQAWRTRLAMYANTGVISETAPAMMVDPVFVKLLIAEFKHKRYVSYSRLKRLSVALFDGSTEVGGSVKRAAIAGDPPPPAPDLKLKGVNPERFSVTPSILRKPGGAELDYLGSVFRLADGNKPTDLAADFDKVKQMLSSLNPLVPQTAAAEAQSPIPKIQGAVRQALDLLRTKCKSIAAHNETMIMTISRTATGGVASPPEILAPKLDQVQTNLLDAVHKLQAVVESKGDGTEAVSLIEEVRRLKEENQKLKDSYVAQRSRAEQFLANLRKQREKEVQYVKLERLKVLEGAGFLINNRYDAPAPTLEACDIVVMNKTSQYWTEFDQDRFNGGDHDQKVASMSGWDPTKPETNAPPWATSFNALCPICSTTIGPEGGYSVGTCKFCIYHVGCLQQVLMMGDKLECPQCKVKFNIRLWQAFRLTHKMQELMPELAEDGRDLPRKTPPMTDNELQEWLLKDQLFIAIHYNLFKKIVRLHKQSNESQFRKFMNEKLPQYIDRKAQSWGLTRPDWVEDLKMNVRIIVYPQEGGLGIPPFPLALVETGLHLSDWPSSFWRPTTGDGAGPSRA